MSNVLSEKNQRKKELSKQINRVLINSRVLIIKLTIATGAMPPTLHIE